MGKYNDIFTPKERLPQEEAIRFSNLVNKLSWREAKTRAHSNPHMYSLFKNHPVKEDFVFYCDFIRKYGHKHRWAKWVYTAVRVNGYLYWLGLVQENGDPEWINEPTLRENGDLRIRLINRRKLEYQTPYDKVDEYNLFFAEESFVKEDEALINIIKPSGKILDLGCGSGLLLDYIEDPYYVGVDMSNKQIEKAKSKYPNQEFIACPVQELYGSNKFDTVVSLYGSCSYFTDVELEVMKEFLAKDGKLYAMFYKEGYEPITHVALDIVVPIRKYKKPEDGIEFGNYIIVTDPEKLI